MQNSEDFLLICDLLLEYINLLRTVLTIPLSFRTLERGYDS